MAADESSWRTTNFRQSVVAKIEEAIRSSGMPTTKNSMEMENHVYQKAKTKEEYLSFVARLILHVREMNSKKNTGMGGLGGPGGPGMQDPINALQTLARQGTGNQMMGLVPQGPPQGTATNLLQSFNQRPGNQPRMQAPVQMGAMGGPMSGQMGGGMQAQMGMGGPMSGPMGPMPGQMGPMGSIPGQMAHISRGKGAEGMMMPGQPQAYAGPRNVPPNQYLQQSPTPPSQSPASMPPTNQMVTSPALAPSPGNPPGMGGSLRSVGMVASPSSSLNTPGQAVPAASPHGQIEEQAYQAKVRQLSKYIEPLRRVVARVGNEDLEKLSKMKKLLEILSTPGKRMPLETLLKCEVVLEKLDLKRGDGAGPPLREQHPLLEAVQTHIQSSVINHTLQRTFGPCLEALFGSGIKMLPPPLKKKKVEEPVDDIPEVLQGEIARLDQRFKVSLDPTQQAGSRSIQLLCVLDDRHLPCVPPVSLTVPEDYPQSPPRCHLAPHEYNATAFLSAVQSALESRVRKLPGRFSVSQLLDTWEMSVRQACAPLQTPTIAGF